MASLAYPPPISRTRRSKQKDPYLFVLYKDKKNRGVTSQPRPADGTVVASLTDMSKNIKLDPGIEGQRFVRVTNVLHEKYVEFEFAIDDPTINIELVLPFDHFRVFCEANNAVHLSPEQEAAVEFDKLKWRFGVPGFTDEKSTSVTSQEKT